MADTHDRPLRDFLVLAPGPLPPLMLQRLEAAAPVLRLWEAADPDKALAEAADRVRAIAATPLTRIDAALLERFANLEIVGSLGVGYDQIDVAAAAARGVIVTHTPDVLTDDVADLAIGLLICAVRRLPLADRFVRDGEWEKGQFPLTASLRGRRLGVLGLGRIGQAIARRAEAFGLTIAYHNRKPAPGVAWPWFDTPAALAQACDTLINVLPGGAATRGLIGAEVFDALGPSGVFVNVGRGSSVDQPALIAALAERRLLAAGLDVFADEPRVPAALRESPYVALTPHVGSSTKVTREAMARLAADNIVSFARGQGPLTPVPETPARRAGGDLNES